MFASNEQPNWLRRLLSESLRNEETDQVLIFVSFLHCEK